MSPAQSLVGSLALAGADGASAMARRPWPQEAAARNRCRSRATWASGQAGHHERRCLSPWPWRPNVPLVGDEARRVLAEAGVDAAASGVGRGGAGVRACRPRCRRAPGPRDLQAQGLGQPVAPVVPPAGAEPCPEAPPDRGEAAGAACQRSRSRLRGQSVSPPPPRSRVACIGPRTARDGFTRPHVR